jgi:hypothetical protein
MDSSRKHIDHNVSYDDRYVELEIFDKVSLPNPKIGAD